MTKILKNLFFVFIFVFLAIFLLSPLTGSSYYDTETSTGNTFSATCWGAPDKPTQISPSEYVNVNDINFQWSATTNHCPLPVDTWYKFEITDVSDFSTILPVSSGFMKNTTNFSVTGLAAREYWWRVQVQDQYNYSDVSSSFHLIIDQTAPVISNVTHLVATPEEENDYLATITWNTDELTTSNLRWSDDGGANWTDLPEDTIADNTSHSLEITGLTTTTTYNYEVRSKDQAGNETTSSGYSFTSGGGDISDFVATTDVVINEFLPNPIGDDFAPKPGGEWVELYNKSTTTPYNLAGWSIGAYNTDTYRLYLTTTNTVTSDPSTSGLIIGPHEFFVVYRNGDSTFYMKNVADDRIRLFNASNVRVDRFMYTVSQVIENKSIARYPDGSDTWFDPIPSPLGANVLESWQLQPEVNYTFDGQKLSFEVMNIEKFNQIEYQLTYNSDSGEQGVIGTNQLSSQSSYKKDEIIFGTCSTGGACTYHQNPKDINLKIILTGESEVINLEKAIQ